MAPTPIHGRRPRTIRAPRRACQQALTLASLLLTLIAGCDRTLPVTEKPPNILLIVWDTVRADHLQPYGYERPTTPRLKEWAAQARVYDNCVSPGSTTVPAHASMFTGLFPSEHGADNEHAQLDQRFTTLAETLAGHGYATYCFSANPFICEARQFTQGFSRVEHPWDEKHIEAATRILREKMDPADRTGELPDKLRNPAARMTAWNVKTAGALAQPSVIEWLSAQPAEAPYFAFLNYMEAHRPLIPSRAAREMLMSPQQVQRSYEVDRSWRAVWAYTFGLKRPDGAELLSDEDIELTRLTYDAALRELDDLLGDLLAALRAAGKLENTVVILTADHGEHLGEHHMLDHQFSVYEELLRVPLIIHDPRHFAPGRETRPVSTIDLFPTLLELAGVPAAELPQSSAISLLRPLQRRERLAEYPTANKEAIRDVKRAREYRDFDPTPWDRGLRAFYSTPWKLIQGSDGRHELYNLADDPRESRNLLVERADIAADMESRLATLLRSLHERGQREAPTPAIDEQTNLLRGLGYIGGASEKEEPASAPTTLPAEAANP